MILWGTVFIQATKLRLSGKTNGKELNQETLTHVWLPPAPICFVLFWFICSYFILCYCYYNFDAYF